jgi:drug/metabolite transporter (DMT)-like permease
LLANKHFQRQQFISGIIICLIGAICFSTKAIFVKLAYRNTDVDAVTLLALRMIFSLPFFVVSAAVSSGKSGNVKFTFKQWIYVAFIGTLGYYVSSLLDFLGLQYVSAGIERLILFIYPTLVLIMSALIFKRHISTNQWIAVAITYTGLMLAFAGELSLHEDRDGKFFIGAFCIFACAITYAIYLVGSGEVIPQVGAAKFNSYAMSFACLAVLLHFFIANENSLLDLPAVTYVYGIAMAILSTVVPSYLVTEGIKRIGSDNAAIVGSVGPVSTIVQAFIFLQEPIFAAQLIGTMLVLVGVLLISKKSGSDIKSSPSRP